MPTMLTGSVPLRCSCTSHTPKPYQRCHCTICRKTTPPGRKSSIRSPRRSTQLCPAPVASVHLMLDVKPSWVELQPGAGDECFARYLKPSIEDWHKRHGV